MFGAGGKAAPKTAKKAPQKPAKPARGGRGRRGAPPEPAKAASSKKKGNSVINVDKDWEKVYEPRKLLHLQNYIVLGLPFMKIVD